MDIMQLQEREELVYRLLFLASIREIRLYMAQAEEEQQTLQRQALMEQMRLPIQAMEELEVVLLRLVKRMAEMVVRGLLSFDINALTPCQSLGKTLLFCCLFTNKNFIKKD